MRLETFFAKFDQLADAPGNVAKLRELILDLAVTGRLVPQDRADTSASVVLAKARAERATLVATRKIKARIAEPVAEDEAPYQVPVGWEWARLSDVGHELGQKIPDKRFTYIDVGCIDSDRGHISERVEVLDANEAPSRARKLVARGTVIYSTVRPYLRNIAIIDRDIDPEPIVSTAFGILQPLAGIHNRYLFHWLRSGPFNAYVQEGMKGMAYPAINDEKFYNGFIPVPPLAEQKRIVRKVDELMALCDRLEAQLKGRDEKHATLARAALARFADAPTPANLELLFHDSFAISPADLRNTIIDTASKGTLARSELSETSIREKLRSRRDERQKLWQKLNRSKKAYKPPLEIDYNDYPQVPPHWGVEVLGLLGVELLDAVQTGPFGSQLLKTEFTKTGVPVVAVRNLTGLGFSSNGLYYITKTKAESLARYDVQAGDLLFARTGATLGKVCLAPAHAENWRMTGHILRVRLDPSLICPKLAVLFLWASDFVKSQITKGIRGMTRPGYNTGLLERILIPVPPMDEQRRIVAKVDQLMALVDKLEVQLTASRATADQLLSALLTQSSS